MTDFDKICYKTNFIKEVVFRLDFSPILQLKKEIDSQFQEKIRDKYLSFEARPLIGITAGIREGKEFFEKEGAFEFEFSNKSKTQRVVVTNSSFVYNVFKYDTFEQFKDEIDFTFSAFSSLYKNLDYKRIGLRYINDISLKEGNPFDWESLINSSLIQLYKGFTINLDTLNRSINQLIFNKDDYQIVMTYGIFNNEYPAKISRREFILDFDCHSTEVNTSKLLDQIITFHSEIQKLFESSISDGLRNIMEKINDRKL